MRKTMPVLQTPALDRSLKAKDFKLQGVDGKMHALLEVKGKNGLVVVFMCNHCPYVRAIIDKLVVDAAKLANVGVGVVGINSNDATNYPDDSYDNMIIFAKEHGINFPYLLDETQSVAKQYGAVCTPDFFCFNKDDQLVYRGRFDDGGISGGENTTRELLLAMQEVAATGKYTGPNSPSQGCSIKWKE